MVEMNTIGFADLHTHTTASDGLHAPAEVVRRAHAAGLTAVAITDHDTVAGIEEALAEGEKLGLHVVPGVELSTVAEGADIHILAYYTRAKDKQWLERLAGLRQIREKRNELIVDKLRSLGIRITMEDVLSAAQASESNATTRSADKSVGSPHIAKALIQLGAVATMNEAFEKYLAAGASAYVNPPRLHPFDALEWIREAGGVSVIAHPGLYGNDALVRRIIEKGAQGIEAFHSDHSQDEENRYIQLAREYGLIITGGSDFHGERLNEVYHGAVGSRTVSMEVVEQLQAKRA